MQESKGFLARFSHTSEASGISHAQRQSLASVSMAAKFPIATERCRLSRLLHASTDIIQKYQTRSYKTRIMAFAGVFHTPVLVPLWLLAPQPNAIVAADCLGDSDQHGILWAIPNDCEPRTIFMCYQLF